MQEPGNVKRLLVRLKARPSQYEITIGSGTLGKVGDEVRRSLVSARRIALVSNPTVFVLYGRTVLGSLRRAGFDISHWLMPDGERHKNMRTLERTLHFFSSIGLDRGDAVVALGGGVVGDLAGMAAALHLRGVPFFQVPTTLLAQIDASIGGKTAVNSRHGKNMIGLIQQPFAVLIDPDVLCTLSRRELTAGWCEAIKQGAAGSRKLFAKTRHSLESGNQQVGNQHRERLSQLITAHCSFKASIVKNDEREDVSSSAKHSRRILNFGHTVGHALELVTGYRRFRHGEAVGVGMLVAGEISLRMEMLVESEFKELDDTIRLAGQLPRSNDLDCSTLLKALRGDKKSVNGAIQWILLERIGRARVVDARDIPRRVVSDSIRAVLRRTK
jgi:3-dehydroquinate synthase